MKRINTNPHIRKYKFRRNKYFPNSKFPVLIYKNALKLPRRKFQAAEIIQQILAKHGWTNAWSNGIYDFHHYHSTTHECMGTSMGSAVLILGGPGGKKIKLEQVNVIILPAGVGHACFKADKNFFCVGAYPQGKDYDMNTGLASEYKKAIRHIRKLSIPLQDPVLGKHGFLKVHWK